MHLGRHGVFTRRGIYIELSARYLDAGRVSGYVVDTSGSPNVRRLIISGRLFVGAIKDCAEYIHVDHQLPCLNCIRAIRLAL